MAESHFVILRQEQIGALRCGISCSDLDEAVRLASEKTESDREPRYVVQLMRQVAIEPKPRVIITDLVEVPNA